MAVVEALVAGIGGAFNSIFQGRQNRKNREFQERENQINRQFAVDMWNKQNEYNLPTNQMQRLRDAGINPHLAYSQGQPMNTSNAPASPTGIGSMPQGVAPQMNIGEVFNALLTSAQVKNMNAQTEKTLAEKKEVESRTVGIDKDNEIKTIELTHKDRQMLAEIGVNEQNIEESKSRVESSVLTNKKVEQEIENLKSQKNLTDQQVDNLKKALVLLDAQINNTKADTNLKILQKGNVLAQTRLLNAQALGQSLQNLYTPREKEAAIQKVWTEIRKLNIDIGDVEFKQLNSLFGVYFNALKEGKDFIPMVP
jgi:hypothetical protein